MPSMWPENDGRVVVKMQRSWCLMLCAVLLLHSATWVDGKDTSPNAKPGSDMRDDDPMIKHANAFVPIENWDVENSYIISNFGGPFDGMDGDTPKDGTLKGGCGYGLVAQDSYPFWHTMSFDIRSHLLKARLPRLGCGSCWRVKCKHTADNKDPCSGEWNGKKWKGKPIVAILSDICPSCSPSENQIDMEYKTWLQLSGFQSDNLVGTFERVACDTFGENIKVKVLDHTKTYTRAVALDVAGYGIVTKMNMHCEHVNEDKKKFMGREKTFEGVNKWGVVYEFYHPVWWDPDHCQFIIEVENGDKLETEFVDIKRTMDAQFFDAGVQFDIGRYYPEGGVVERAKKLAASGNSTDSNDDEAVTFTG